MSFYDMLNALREPDDNGVPETIYDDIAREYDTLKEGYQANTETHLNKIAELETEVNRLKSKNYDLLITSGTDIRSENQEEIDEDKPVTLDDLFAIKSKVK